jgi:hypothetical protein
MRLFLMVLLAAFSVQAEAERRFGDQGEVVPSGGAAFTTGSGATSISLAPSLQYFVARGLAVGVGVSFGHTSSSGNGTSTVYGGEVSLGYDLPLATRLSFFPRAFFGGTHADFSTPPGVTVIGAGSSGAIDFGVFAPVLFHPVEHFFLGFGPELATFGASSDPFRSQSFALVTTIGGWI